jgi:putative MFS transporter
MLCGAVGMGSLADRMGRRAALQLSVTLFAAFSGLCALAQNPWQLTLLRFFVGLGLGGVIPTANTVLAELLPARARGRLVALWAVSFPLGGLLTSLMMPIMLAASGWRGLFLVGLVPALLVPVVGLLPESPHYLLAAGRPDAAQASVHWLSGGKRAGQEPAAGAAAAPPAEPSSPLAVPLPAGAPPPGTALSTPSVGAVLKQLFSPALLRATCVAWTMTFCWSFAFFGMVLWLPSLLALSDVPVHTVLLYVVGFQISAVAGRVVMLFFVDRWGRKRVIVLCGGCAAVLTGLFGVSNALVWLVPVGFLLSFFEDGGMSGVVPYTPELYPSQVRSTAVGWAAGTGRVAGLLAPLLVGTLIESNLHTLIFLLFAACYLCGATVVARFGHETDGRLIP